MVSEPLKKNEPFLRKVSLIIVAFPLSDTFLAWLTSVIAFIITTG